MPFPKNFTDNTYADQTVIIITYIKRTTRRAAYARTPSLPPPHLHAYDRRHQKPTSVFGLFVFSNVRPIEYDKTYNTGRLYFQSVDFPVMFVFGQSPNAERAFLDAKTVWFSRCYSKQKPLRKPRSAPNNKTDLN